MNYQKCEHIADLIGGKWDKVIEQSKRVYSDNGLCPTLHTCGGGNQEIKIMEENRFFKQALETAKKNEKMKRVRKLTEQECFKLMGVKPNDYKRVRKNQSKSSCYHLAGDSIVTACLMALFGQMLDIDWKEKVQKTVEDIIK